MTQLGTDILIDIASTFSAYPSGRFPTDGHFNGELFRNSILAPALEQAVASSGSVIVDIDGVRSFGSSFLEEAFGGLIRLGLFSSDVVRGHLKVRCTKSHLQFFKDEIDNLVATSVLQPAKVQ